MRRRFLVAASVCAAMLLVGLGGTASAVAGASAADEPYEYVNFDPEAPFPSGEPFDIPADDFPAGRAAARMAAPQAQARGVWTWSSATHPAGSAYTADGTSGGGVWLYEGMYYVPGIGHVHTTLGSYRSETITGSGGLGNVSHSDFYAGKNADIALVATGLKPIALRMRVSHAWQDALIRDVTHTTVTKGTTLCHSGTSQWNRDRTGYRCGKLAADCVQGVSFRCTLTNLDGLGAQGDSGGPVWWYQDDGVKLFGWLVSAYPEKANGAYTSLTFVPVWVIQNHSWSTDQTWQGGSGVAPFPSGPQTTGCFVTIAGCVRS